MNQKNKWALSDNCVKFVIDNTLPGATVVELGAGTSTKKLSKIFNLYSIEQSCNIFYTVKDSMKNGRIFYAPLINNWYDLTGVTLPSKQSTIIIDGPKGPFHRHLFMEHLDHFDLTSLIIVDDVGCKNEFKLFNSLLTLLGRPSKIIREQYKSWGYINRA